MSAEFCFYYQRKNCMHLFDFRDFFENCNKFILAFNQNLVNIVYFRGPKLYKNLDLQISLA